MKYPDLRVGGGIDSGLIITASLVPHLAGVAVDREQVLILTPMQGFDMLRQMLGKFVTDNVIERMAMRIYENEGGVPSTIRWTVLSDFRKNQFRIMAKAAIEPLMEQPKE